jgi:hypothetical protein
MSTKVCTSVIGVGLLCSMSAGFVRAEDRGGPQIVKFPELARIV